MKRLLFQGSLIFLISSLLAVNASASIGDVSQESSNLVNIFEVVVAGIIASAIVLSLFALFIGKWSGKKQNDSIKKIYQEIEKDKKNAENLVEKVASNAVETQKMLRELKNKTSAITSKQHQAWVQVEDIEQMVEDAIDCSSELKQTTDEVNQRMAQIQHYWDEQLKETANIVHQVQSTLEEGLARVESGLDALNEKEIKSHTLAQKVIDRYHQQSEALSENEELSSKIKANLDKASEESQDLLEQLNIQKESASELYQKFSDDIDDYESRLYDRFDNVFQATDIARKELDAHVNESRLHLDNLRRYEEEGHNIKLQIRDHLEVINSQSIDQLATTLENTQQMFSSLQNDVQDAQYAIDTLRKIKNQILDTPEEQSVDDSKEHLASKTDKPVEKEEEFLAISGDSTLIPFFSRGK